MTMDKRSNHSEEGPFPPLLLIEKLLLDIDIHPQTHLYNRVRTLVLTCARTKTEKLHDPLILLFSARISEPASPSSETIRAGLDAALLGVTPAAGPRVKATPTGRASNF